ncbi:B12-binding domain-containing radical SAM protein [Geovibrio thiophilus]|uniref:B12-binding domain-containing radical SAM protein n=1 Tax=Geovibrio thiophilus TaxID=139438 RepID=A0A3R5Y861_9BACT|nr:radical SAM protein [Geovibrio thiophilus]QAR34010.1 B12-binding domain-containing radical SAM protein [Geovibrio thiophilus]
MNIVLINMNQLDTLHSTNTIPILQGYIAAYLKKHNHDVLIVDDLKDASLSLESLNKLMQEFRPKVIGFTGYHYLMERIRFFARFIKEYYPETKLILGGPQALFLPVDGLMELYDFDIICNRGEGELTTLKIAEALENGNTLHNVPGILFKDNNEIIATKQPSCLPQNLDLYPSPYTNQIIDLSMKKSACIFTSRGCEHFCNFCVTPLFNHRNIRFHSVEHVLEEMSYLEAVGMENLWIGDPNFTAYKDRTIELLEQKIKRGIKIPFWCQTRVDMVDNELLKLMQRAGLYCIGFGLESGTDKILSNMCKDVSLSKFHEIVTFTQSLSVKVELFSMYGQPGETYEDAIKTISTVRGYGIPIYANSCAQQLQLVYGSVYGRNPGKYGFKTATKHIPRYLSFWHEYETDCLTRSDIKKIQATWTLYNAETDFNVKNCMNIFHTIDFILEHKDILKEEKRFYEYWIHLGALLEDKEIIMQCINDFRQNISADKKELKKLLRHAELYSVSGVVQNSSRVIIFCQYAGQYLPEKHYLKPGLNELRHNFPKEYLKGMKVKDSIKVSLDDRSDVSVIITIIGIFNKVKIKDVKQLSGDHLWHNYSFINHEVFEKSHNELLFFLTLKSIPYTHLARIPQKLLLLISFYSKMHKFYEIEKLYESMISTNSTHIVAETFGDILSYADKHHEAMQYYNKSHEIERVILKKAYSYMKLNKYNEAYNIIKNIDGKDDIIYWEIMLACLENLFPAKKEIIRNTSHKLMTLKVHKVIENNKCSVLDSKIK